MARWKSARARKKEPAPLNKARLVGCLVVLASALLLFYILFAAFLRR